MGGTEGYCTARLVSKQFIQFCESIGPLLWNADLSVSSIEESEKSASG